MRCGMWLACTLTAAPAVAQRAVPVTEPVAYVGGSFVVAQPVRDFADYVAVGFGVGGHAVWKPVPGGPFGLRIDGDVLIYGSETRRYPLVPLVDVDVTTQNQIVGFQLGPELTFGRAVQPYLFGEAGFSYFATTSSVEGTNSSAPFAETTNFDDFTWATVLGGGLRINLSDRQSRVMLDLGARYVINGQAQYLREGSIQINGTDVTITPIESETNFVLYHIGVSVGLRPGRDRDR